MAAAAARPSLSRGIALGGVLWALLLRLGAEQPPSCFELVVHIAPGMRTTPDQPMSVLWIEDGEGHFVATLWRFGRNLQWYRDLTVWHDLSTPREASAEVDAVTGATIIQGSQARLRVPTRWHGIDLLSGHYVLRIESRKDQAKHYSAFRVPLAVAALDHRYADAGYVRSLELSSPAAAVAAPRTVIALAVDGAIPVQSAHLGTGTVGSTGAAPQPTPSRETVRMPAPATPPSTPFPPPSPSPQDHP